MNLTKPTITLCAALILGVCVFQGGLQAAPLAPSEQAPEPAETGQRVIQTPFGATRVPAPDPPLVAVPAAPVEPAAGPEVAQPEPAPAQGLNDPSPVQLDLDNVDIYQAIRIIGETLGLNYVIDPTVEGTVNISTSESLQRSDLLPILETILKINGASMVRNGNYYEIIPVAGAIGAPLEVQIEPDALAPGDSMVVQVVRLRFVSASEISTLLTPYLSEGAGIVVHSASNVLLITERRSNLRKIMDVIDIFDAAVFENERVRIIPVENALVGDVVSDMESVFAGYSLSEESGGGVRFVPIERLNSVLVITSVEETFREVERWLGRLDQPVSNTGVRNYVYKVRNSKAIDIQNVVGQLYGGGVQSASSTSALGLGLGADATGAVAVTGATGFVPLPTAVFAGQGQPGQNDTRIIADEITNSLIIHATAQDYEEIRQIIEELDILPRQVLVDAQIYEVALDDSLSLGLSAALQNRGTLGTAQTTAAFTGNPASLSASTFAFIGRTRELVAFLNASENRSKVRTVSAPSVMVSDNTTANFHVGAEVPIPTSSALNPSAGSAELFSFAQTIQFRTTGVILNVRPQINDGGRVTLEIEQEISQAGANTTSDIVAPVIGTSSVSSTIVVQDGQTIALGGFIRENQERAQSRLPILGRIPGVGALFGSTRNATTRSELVILITPHVIQDFDAAAEATELLKSKLREVQTLLDD